MTRKRKLKVSVLQRGGNKSGHDFIKQAVEFYAKELLSTRMVNTLDIKVKMRVTGRSKTADGHVGINVNGSANQRQFVINIERDASLVDQLCVLAHEMVHVEQVAMKRLQYRVNADKQIHVRWEKESLGKLSLIPYAVQPWEIEARKIQVPLKNKFFKEVMYKIPIVF